MSKKILDVLIDDEVIEDFWAYKLKDWRAYY